MGDRRRREGEGREKRRRREGEERKRRREEISRLDSTLENRLDVIKKGGDRGGYFQHPATGVIMNEAQQAPYFRPYASMPQERTNAPFANIKLARPIYRDETLCKLCRK